MTPETREEWIIHQARERPNAERSAFLDGACAGDVALRERLEALLAVHDQTERAMEPAGACPTINLDLSDAPDEAVGQTLGRYKLLERIGEGGCGVVYVAEQTEPVRRRVALKVIKLGMDTKQVVARFEAERQALAMMDHPNIAKVLDAGTTSAGSGGGSQIGEGRPYFVMELVRGIRITDYCDQSHLSTKDRLDLFIKVCQAIQHAHQKGIIHRDIKPSNILVTLHDGLPVPKVIDFGIAKATEGRLTDATVYTQLHQFIGTPAYMSPEQAEMSGLDIDTRSDVYSLGVLLYELLTGVTPFDAKELMSQGIDAMRRTIREKEPLRPSTKLAALQGEELTTTAKRRSVDTSRLLHQLKGDLDWIAMKCLEKDRTRRYETANGLAADIKRHLSNEPVAARPPSAAYRFQKAFRRHKLVFAAGGAVALALIGGTTISTWLMFRATRAERQQSQSREVAVRAFAGEKEQRAQAEAERERADTQARKAKSSEQQSRRLLYDADMNLSQQAVMLNNIGRARRLLDRHRPLPGEEDLRGWEWRYLWQLTRSSALVNLTNRPTRGFSVSFSPNGTLLAVGWFDGRVDLWNVPERRWIRSLAQGQTSTPGIVAFAPGGNRLAATSDSSAVVLYDLDSGRESVLWKAPDQNPGSVRDLEFSSDGSKLAIYLGANRQARDRDEVLVVNVSSSTIESRHSTLFSSDFHFGAALFSPDNLRLYLARSDFKSYRWCIQCIDLATGKELWQTEHERDQGLTTLAISPDGRMLASGSGYEDPTIRIWDAATGGLRERLRGHTAWVCELVFSQNGQRLVSAASDQTIRLWDTTSWKETRVLRGHTDEVHAVAIAEAAQMVASAGKDGDLMLWKEDGKSAMDGYRCLMELSVTPDPPQVLRLGRSRMLLLSRGEPGVVLDLKRDFPSPVLPAVDAFANSFGFFGTNFLCHWDGTNQVVVSEMRGEEFITRGAITLGAGARPIGLAYNPRRQFLAWMERNAPNSVWLANLAAPSRRIELKSDVVGTLQNLSFNEGGTYLLTHLGEALRVWDVDTGNVVAARDGGVDGAVFARGGRVLVCASTLVSGHEIRFYDLAHPDQPPRICPGKHFASSVVVSPDGELVASVTGGGEVRLFDPLKGELIDTLHGHLNATFALDFSPDGRRLISTSGGREAVKLWDVATRQELLTLSGTGSTLGRASWTADGDVIMSGPPWQAWRAPSWAEIDAAEAKERVEQR